MELIRFFFSFSGQVNQAKYWIGVGIVFAVSLLALLFWSALPVMGVQVALLWLVICVFTGNGEKGVGMPLSDWGFEFSDKCPRKSATLS